MDYVGTILKILSAGLSIWSDREANKYKEMVLKLEQRIMNEKRKPIFVKGMDPKGDYRNDDVIDDCIRQLLLIGRHFSDSVAGKS